MDIPKTVSERRALVTSRILPSIDTRPFINGQFVSTGTSELVDVLDPMTQLQIAQVPCAEVATVRTAVESARKAFDDMRWCGMHPRNRAKILYRIADLIDRDIAELALVEAVDAGKRLQGVLAWDIPNAAEVFRYYAGWCDKIAGEMLPSALGVEMQLRREPVGVVAAIIPWNFPFPCTAWKVAPALAAGCTVVVKSSERAPLSLQYFASIVREAGIPDGVVNVLTGIGESTGRALVSDSRIDKITFSGATETARDIVRNSLGRMPRTSFELGDKGPFVIFEDADIDRASTAAIGALFGVSGQSCSSAPRLLLQESMYREVLDRIIQAASTRILGDQLADGTEQGPQIDTEHVARIDRFVQEARVGGADILTGGHPTGDLGQFYEPTVIVGARSDSPICRSEVFGPVGLVIPFKDIDEAIRIANDRDFGLAATVWASKSSIAESFVARCNAGTVWVNCYEYFDSIAPWGGRKLSGGGRELGKEGIEGFYNSKTVVKQH